MRRTATATAPRIDVNQPESVKGVGAELAATTQSLAVRLAGSAITDLASLGQAVSDRQLIGESVKRVQEFFTPFKAMAHKLHKALCDRENEILGPLLRLDAEKRTAISAFKDEQDRARQARERALVDQQRRENETRAAHEAALLEASGDREMAAAVLADAIAAPAPVVVLADETEDVEGLQFTRRWLWRYAGGPKDIKQTPPQVLARTLQLIPREFLCVDEKKVGAYVRSMKNSGRIPGLEIYYVDDPVR